ncbi:MAG TPA: hypothetical protein VIL65_08095 [Beijerinckiaceae bacterium]|jgi:hypothetical protein
MRSIACVLGVAAIATILAPPASAQSCRAQAIMASQCTWPVLEEFGTDARAAKRAEQAATSGLIDGCTPGQYQMVLLRGTDVTQTVAQRLRSLSATDARSVQTACQAAAQGSAR